MFQPRNITAGLADKSYYPAFDYLRAIAAIGVYVSHADRSHFFPAQLGNACVQVFFALSGFLIGSILLRSKIEDVPRFFFNRSTRIWIPYAIAIAILFVVTAIKQGFSDPKFAEFFIYKLTFVLNWFGVTQVHSSINHMPLNGTGNHFWSICVEEQFYLVAPFVLLLLHRSVAVLALVAVVALNFLQMHHFTAIAMGVLLAMTGRAWWFIGITAAATALCMRYLTYAEWMPFAGVTIVALAGQLRGEPSEFAKLIGGASYPFYLNHWIGLFGLAAGLKLGIPFLPSAAIGLAISSLIAVFHYMLIDRWIAAHRAEHFTQRRGALLCGMGFALVAIGTAYGITR